MKFVRKRLTYANVMSSVAVFLVLAGGSALAASQLGKNTVGSKQLKKNAVTAAKIKNGAVTGAKVNLSTLGTVPAATNATNSKTADTAKSADSAKTAQTATSAETAKTATSAKTAESATVANSAFSVNSADDVLSFNGSANSPTTVATLVVPAGNYFILGKALVNNNSAATATANCALSAGGAVIDSGFDNTRVSKEGGEADRQYLVVSGVASLPSGGTVAVECKTTSTEGNWLDRTLSAVQVKTVG